MTASGLSVLVTLGIQTGITSLVILLFSLLRKTQFAGRFYAPKAFDTNIIEERRPKVLPPGLFTWITSMYSHQEEEIIKIAGVDVAVCINALIFGWETVLKVLLWTCLVILPINLSGNNLDVEYADTSVVEYADTSNLNETEVTVKKYSITSFDKCSMANIEPGSSKMWAHLVSVYIITFFVLKGLWRYNKHVTNLRVRFQEDSDAREAYFTVLITDVPGVQYGTLPWYLKRLISIRIIPEALRTRIIGYIEAGIKKIQGEIERFRSDVLSLIGDDATDKSQYLPAQSPPIGERVLQEMESVYGLGTVDRVDPVIDHRKLKDLLSEYKKVKQSLEDYIDHCASLLKRRRRIKKAMHVTVFGPSMGKWGIEKYGVKPIKVLALQFWPERLKELVNNINEITRNRTNDTENEVPSAFVTFNSRSLQCKAVTNLHHHSETDWIIHQAPVCDDVIWENIGMRSWERIVRTSFFWGVYMVLLFFYIVPVSAIQALIEVPRLANVNVIGDIVTLPFVQHVLEGVLPSLVMYLLLVILPKIFAVMCKLSGFISFSSVDFGVIDRYFYFQLIALFMGSVLTGSFMSQFSLFIEYPGKLISLLGMGIPMTSTFFINYLAVAGLTKTGLKHLRMFSLIKYVIMSRLASTQRAYTRLWKDQFTNFGPDAPFYTIAFLIGIVYSCINPVIMAVLFIYYSTTILSERYTNLYVFKRRYESGGRLWSHMFNQFLVGLYAMQIVMIILLSIKEFTPVFLLVPAPFITFVFHVVCHHLFKRPWSVMSSRDAAILDRKDRLKATSHEIKSSYVHPATSINETDVIFIIDEADKLCRLINGDNTLEFSIDGSTGMSIIRQSMVRVNSGNVSICVIPGQVSCNDAS